MVVPRVFLGNGWVAGTEVPPGAPILPLSRLGVSCEVERRRERYVGRLWQRMAPLTWSSRSALFPPSGAASYVPRPSGGPFVQ